jgi:hypothetical protein
MPASKTPQSRAFVAAVRAGEASAIDKIRLALQGTGGDVLKTAALLGVGKSAIYRWGDEIPAVKVVLDQHSRGRIGPPPKKKAPVKRARKKVT